jgi:hypothetical protein
MRWWITLFLALSVVQAPRAWAQNATDAELLAGYCFAASTLGSFIGKTAAVQDCEGAQGICLQTREDGAMTQRIFEKIHKRAEDYLNARRLFQERFGSVAWIGVERAMKDAQEDFKMCTGEGTGRNRNLDACQRMGKCRDIERLPF